MVTWKFGFYSHKVWCKINMMLCLVASPLVLKIPGTIVVCWWFLQSWVHSPYLMLGALFLAARFSAKLINHWRSSVSLTTIARLLFYSLSLNLFQFTIILDSIFCPAALVTNGSQLDSNLCLIEVEFRIALQERE